MSEPPHASSWATPPEFYVDENIAGRTLCREVRRLGYPVHTPPELYGTREAAESTADVVWLRDVGERRWAVLGRDTKIFERAHELAAYKAAHLHMFLFPGQATRAELVELVRSNLAEICTATTVRSAHVYRVGRTGLIAL